MPKFWASLFLNLLGPCIYACTCGKLVCYFHPDWSVRVIFDTFLSYMIAYFILGFFELFQQTNFVRNSFAFTYWIQLEACAHPFFDELRKSEACLPNGHPLPPLFDFTPQGKHFFYCHDLCFRTCANIFSIVNKIHSSFCQSWPLPLLNYANVSFQSMQRNEVGTDNFISAAV